MRRYDRHYTDADARAIAEALALPHVQVKRVSGEWRTTCPVHNDNSPSLDVRIRDGELVWTCRAGCDQRATFEAIRARGLLKDGREDGGWFEGPRPRAPRKPKRAPDTRTRDIGRRFWRASDPLVYPHTHKPGSPPLAWAFRKEGRAIWPDGADWPASLRWYERRNPGGPAGAIVAAIAPLDAWLLDDEEPPEPRGVHLLYVGADGLPARDSRGLTKRTYGGDAGFSVLWRPTARGPSERLTLHVVEGVADALRVLMERPGDVAVCRLGTRLIAAAEGGVDFARRFKRVVCWADGGAPGLGAARADARRLRLAGANAMAIGVGAGDPASVKRLTTDDLR